MARASARKPAPPAAGHPTGSAQLQHSWCQQPVRIANRWTARFDFRMQLTPSCFWRTCNALRQGRLGLHVLASADVTGLGVRVTTGLGSTLFPAHRPQKTLTCANCDLCDACILTGIRARCPSYGSRSRRQTVAQGSGVCTLGPEGSDAPISKASRNRPYLAAVTPAVSISRSASSKRSRRLQRARFQPCRSQRTGHRSRRGLRPLRAAGRPNSWFHKPKLATYRGHHEKVVRRRPPTRRDEVSSPSRCSCLMLPA